MTSEDMPGVPAPTGLASLQLETVAPSGEPLKFTLEFDATQAEPPLESLFLAKGGTLAGAAARSCTQFAVTGSAESISTRLSGQYGTTVRIPLPEGMATANVDKALTLDMDNRSKLLITGLRTGAAINGTMVDTMSGQGAMYLANMLRMSAGSATVPLTYANWLAHSAVVAASNMRVIDQHGQRYGINFVELTDRDKVLAHAEQVLGKWAEGAWAMRTAEDGLRYKYSPTLTKCVARVPCGINDTGYVLVHDVLEMKMPYSWATLNSMFSNALQVELEFMPEDIASFLGETKVPGLKAAKHARSLGASLSMLASLLISYRADGRTRLNTDGSQQAIAAESWHATGGNAAMGDDCDGAALLTQAMVNAIGKAPTEVLAQYEYLNAVKNITVPYYTVGVTVLGASGAEASGGGSATSSAKQLAGHAATLLVPTLSLLRALDKGAGAHVGGAPVVEVSKRVDVAAARLAACFPSEVAATLPAEESGALEMWTSAQLHATELVAYGVEGTTPASPILYATGQAATDSAFNAAADTAAFAKVSPNVGRSIKILHVGGSDAGNPHKFYHDFVEFDVARTHALWSHEAVRTHGVAATQFVLGKPPSRVSGAMSAAGVSPREVVSEEYAAVPLVVANENTAKILDYASEYAAVDIQAPSSSAKRLDSFQTQQLEKSLALLSSLDDALNSADNTEGHTVAYLLAYNTLINNTASVEHFCNRLKQVAVSGTVDALDVEGMALTPEGAEAGKFVIINVCIPL